MAKAQSKKKRAGRVALATKRRSGAVVELKPKEARTVQRTVRVPTEIDRALEAEVAPYEGRLSVPAAIVQILQEWHKTKAKAGQPA